MRQNKKRVILLTRRFPFFKTEAFLEAEIEILAKGFDEVIIIPTEKSLEMRGVPGNVIIDKDFSTLFQNKKKRLFRAIFSLFFWNALYTHYKELKSIKAIKQLFQFSSSVLVYKDYLKQFEFFEDDIFYTYWFTEGTKALVDLKITKNINVVSRAHRYDIYEGLESTPLFWPFRSQVLNGIDCLYSISEDGKKYLEGKYKVFNKVIVSKLGVYDRGKLSPVPEKNQIYIVSVSRIAPMKRVNLISESIIAFAKMNPEIKVYWIHFGEGEDRSKIKNSVPDLPNLSIKLDGAVSNQEVYKFYENTPVSLFINLSSSEGIPVSIMEAQSFGIPVIATNVGGSGEIVKKNTGRLLSANPTIEEVNYAIKEIVSEDLNRELIKGIWNKNFNATKNYMEFVEHLKQISPKNEE